MEPRKFCLNIPVFLLAFAVGILYVYLKQPPYTVIKTYPTPDNAGKIVYTDSANNCFIYTYEKTECTKDVKTAPPVVNKPTIE